MAAGLLIGADRLPAIDNEIRMNAMALQHGLGDFGINGIVLRHQNPQSGQILIHGDISLFKLAG